MASEKKIAYVLLGLLSHEDLTGYEIKKRMDTRLSFFWGASYGSIYPALRELVENGFADKTEADQDDRNKIVYSITIKGRGYLVEWLELAAERDEIRFETLLKLFFAGEAEPESAIMHIENFEERIRGELPYLEMVVEELEPFSADGVHTYILLTAKCGVKTYAAFLEWCEEAKQTLRGEL